MTFKAIAMISADTAGIIEFPEQSHDRRVPVMDDMIVSDAIATYLPMFLHAPPAESPAPSPPERKACRGLSASLSPRHTTPAHFPIDPLLLFPASRPEAQTLQAQPGGHVACARRQELVEDPKNPGSLITRNALKKRQDVVEDPRNPGKQITRRALRGRLDPEASPHS